MRSPWIAVVSLWALLPACVDDAPPPESPELQSLARSRGRDRPDVAIIRDDKGVPHLYAGSVRALFYGVGYAQGQDRLWQAETLRRAATGTLAEWFGASSLASDVQARTLFGPPERRAALVAGARAETRVILEAFAAGMNAWIAEATATGRLPAEYAAFGVAPRPWTVDDSVALFLLLGSQFGWFGSDELSNAAAYADLVARLGPEEGRAPSTTPTGWRIPPR